MSHPDVEPFLSGLTEERLRAAFRDPDTEALVIETGGTVAGMLRIDRSTFARHRSLDVHTLAVDARLRGEGIGPAALRALLERELARGVHRIQAETYGFNTAALRTFTSVGFVHEGTRRAAWWRHDEWQDGLQLGWLAPA